MKKIENILNCRPPTPLSDDPSDFSYLSPISLLNLGLNPSLLFGKFCNRNGLRKSWRIAQLMADQLWSNWQKFYLSLLQKRQKWTGTKRNLSVDDLVLLKDSNMVRNQWSRARIVKVYPDRDGIVRRVEVMTSSRKCYIRDVRYICPFEV